MQVVTVMGSGAAPGVPSVACGWGNCNPNNPKNIRLRAGTFFEFDDTKILVDTSPDLRLHLLKYNIRKIDAVLLTHGHADHLHGIDDLREINRITRAPIDFYATGDTYDAAVSRFGYLFSAPGKKLEDTRLPMVVPHKEPFDVPFMVNNVKITPIKLEGHNVPSTGYIFNDGQVVMLSDFESINSEAMMKLQGKIKLLILPLTTPQKVRFHADFDMIMEYIKFFAPEKAVLTHMAAECDYDEINKMTPDNVIVGYDGLKIDLEKL